METPIIPTAKAMRYLTCMKLVPENIMKTIIEEAKAGKEWISFEDEFNIMSYEVIWALETLGYKIYKQEDNTYFIKWF